MINGGVMPVGSWRSWVCDEAVTCATELLISVFGWKKTFTTAIPFSDCDSMCSILLTTVVRFRSVTETIRSDISCGASPVYVQMMLITGILIFGNMSVGVRTIASGPRM